MTNRVHKHYELYPYPHYSLLASVRRCDTYAINLNALWIRFNSESPPNGAKRILIAGCGSFSPYPFSVANPDSKIIALDISQRTLERAKLHCLLHLRSNVVFEQGDLLEMDSKIGVFGLIDAYGVLHHLERPLAGLKALAARLVDGGILRLMIYSRYARKEEESIRRALRLLGIRDTVRLRQLIEKSKPGSRLYRFAKTSFEATFDAGLADALLHPCVKTFLIDDVMELIRRSGLKPLMFAHDNSEENVEKELTRIRELEAKKQSPGNFVIYLGRNVHGACQNDENSSIILNPCLGKIVDSFHFGSVNVSGRLGYVNPLLNANNRNFLKRFVRPVAFKQLDFDSRIMIKEYIKSLFLLQYDR